MTRESPKYAQHPGGLTGCRYKNVAIRDRHTPRATAYLPNMKKGGGGKANWGREGDYHDEAGFPLNEPFEDPAVGAEIIDNAKLRVHRYWSSLITCW